MFVNEYTGWAVGIKGTIIKSTDGGENWNMQQSGTSTNLRKVYFLNSNTGFALGDNSNIFMTVNGGLNWTQQFLNDSIEFNGIYFLNQNTGFISGFNNVPVGFGGIILKTTNGGLNWIRKCNTGGGNNFNTIQFVNNDRGYAGGNGTFFYSTNSGENWSSWYFMCYGWDFHFIDTSNAIIVGDDRCIYKTTNGGINFISIYTSSSSFFISISMLNSNLAYVVGQNGIIIKTTNFGDNWTTQQSGTTQELKSVFFIDSIKGWVVGNNGIILKTTNGGSNWHSTSQGALTNYSSSSFINSNTGWISGYNSIVKTTNGGNNWTEQWDSAGHNLESIHFINENTGWGIPTTVIYAAYISVYKTTNSGNNWFCVGALNATMGYTSQGANLYKVHFINEFTGWVCGTLAVWFPPSYVYNVGIMSKTTNGGINWNTFEMSSSTYLLDIKFINSLTGWSVGSPSFITKTTDGGNTWIQQQGGYAVNYKVAPLDENNVYILSYSNSNYNTNGYVSKTTNGGLNWTGKLVCDVVAFYGLNFVNENVGWICGNNGYLYATSNGGINWYFQPTPTNYPLYNIAFTNESTGWAIGNNGTILKTVSGVTSGVNIFEKISPISFRLYQNYPNPFNPTTNIKYQITNNSFVKLKIYDILGREIEMLVNEKLSPGSYEVSWNASAYPSGIYFYRLIAGDYVQTKKMILIK